MRGLTRITHWLAIFTLLAILAVAAPTAHAGSVYDAAADFSIISNPNGVWSYGYETSLGSTFLLYDETHINWERTSGLDAWTSSSTTDRDPNVSHNRTNMDIMIPIGN